MTNNIFKIKIILVLCFITAVFANVKTAPSYETNLHEHNHTHIQIIQHSHEHSHGENILTLFCNIESLKPSYVLEEGRFFDHTLYNPNPFKLALLRPPIR